MNTETDGFYARVSLGFSGLSNSALITFVRHVIAMMGKNTSGKYKTPSPDLGVVTTAVDTFAVAVQEALDRGKLAIVARNAKRAELVALMKQLAAYVQNNCGDDLGTLLSSGFDAVRSRSPVAPVQAPADVALSRNGHSGQLHLRYRKVRNAANYSVQIATKAEGPWTDQPLSSGTRVTIRNVTPGTIYWARVAANGAAGPSDWVGSASVMAV
jgi:hypothetical protein